MCVLKTQRNSRGSAPTPFITSQGRTPLKIIYISHLHPPFNATIQNIGGMQTVSLQLLEHLQQRSDLSVFPLVLESPWQGTEIRTLGFLIKLLGTLPSVIHRQQADLVLFSSMVTAALAPLLSHRVTVPMVTINHGQDVTLPTGLYQQWVPKIFRHLQGVISVSTATQTASLQRGLSPTKSFVLPNAMSIRPRPYHKQRSRAFIEQAFQLDLTGKHLLLSVGRQVKRKGHAWFIQQVLPSLNQPVVYLLIGQGPEAEHLQQLKERAPIPEHIVLAGTTTNEVLQHAYDASDLFIMPNIPVQGDMEGFGVVVLEANEARTPVIASDLEGLRDVVQEGCNGFKVCPLNAQQFAKTIDTVLDSKLVFLSDTAYEWVTQHYAWPSVCDRYVEVLRIVRESRCHSQVRSML